MRWILSLCVLMLAGCVQVDDGTVNTPVDAKPDTEFANADKEIVAKLIAAPELQDAALLRKYAAYCKGAAELIRNQTDVPLTDILTGVKKSNAVFIGVKSPTLQKIAVGLLPESGGSEDDRAAIAAKWDSLSVSCHAAAHQLDKQPAK